jgi:hypothetical protein
MKDLGQVITVGLYYGRVTASRFSWNHILISQLLDGNQVKAFQLEPSKQLNRQAMPSALGQINLPPNR